jgi:hypothetical protein
VPAAAQPASLRSERRDSAAFEYLNLILSTQNTNCAIRSQVPLSSSPSRTT